MKCFVDYYLFEMKKHTKHYEKKYTETTMKTYMHLYLYIHIVIYSISIAFDWILLYRLHVNEWMNSFVRWYTSPHIYTCKSYVFLFLSDGACSDCVSWSIARSINCSGDVWSSSSFRSYILSHDEYCPLTVVILLVVLLVYHGWRDKFIWFDESISSCMVHQNEWT